MSFRLVVSNTISVPVAGRLPDASGRAVPFSFTLTARRLPATELLSAIESNDRTVPEFLDSVMLGWSGVQDDDGVELPFSASALNSLLDIVGMAGLVLKAYIEACGAKGKEKN
jgi:hypothetical protein